MAAGRAMGDQLRNRARQLAAAAAAAAVALQMEHAAASRLGPAWNSTRCVTKRGDDDADAGAGAEHKALRIALQRWERVAGPLEPLIAAAAHVVGVEQALMRLLSTAEAMMRVAGQSSDIPNLLKTHLGIATEQRVKDDVVLCGNEQRVRLSGNVSPGPFKLPVGAALDANRQLSESPPNDDIALDASRDIFSPPQSGACVQTRSVAVFAETPVYDAVPRAIVPTIDSDGVTTGLWKAVVFDADRAKPVQSRDALPSSQGTIRWIGASSSGRGSRNTASSVGRAHPLRHQRPGEPGRTRPDEARVPGRAPPRRAVRERLKGLKWAEDVARWRQEAESVCERC